MTTLQTVRANPSFLPAMKSLALDFLREAEASLKEQMARIDEKSDINDFKMGEIMAISGTIKGMVHRLSLVN